MDTKIKIIIFIFVAIAILYIVNLFIIAMNKIKTKENFVEMKVEKFDDTNNEKKNYDIRLTMLDEIEKFVPDKNERTSMLNDLFSQIDYFKQYSTEELPKQIEAFVSQKRKEKFDQNFEVPGSGDKPLITNDKPLITNNKPLITNDSETLTTVKPLKNQNITNSEEIIPTKSEEIIPTKVVSKQQKYDSKLITNLSNDITKIYNELGIVKTKMNDINTTNTNIETFVDGNIPIQKIISENTSVIQENINSLINGYEHIRSYATYSTLF